MQRNDILAILAEDNTPPRDPSKTLFWKLPLAKGPLKKSPWINQEHEFDLRILMFLGQGGFMKKYERMKRFVNYFNGKKMLVTGLMSDDIEWLGLEATRIF